MGLKRVACRIFVAMLVIGATACVDDSYRIDEVSTEVTLVSGKTTLPIGFLETKKIGELLENVNLEGLTTDEHGNFFYGYSGVGQTESIDGIKTSFTVPGTQNRFLVHYPSIDLSMLTFEVNDESNIDYNNNDFISHLQFSSGELTEEMVPLLPTINGSYSNTFTGDQMHLLFDVPEQISMIKRVLFKGDDTNYGAPLHLSVAFNGLAGVNGGGKVNLSIELDGVSFRLVDQSGNLIYDGNCFVETYDIAAGAETVDLMFYVESIDLDAKITVGEQLDIPLELKCDMDFEVSTQAGSYDILNSPKFRIDAYFEYSDAEIFMDKDSVLVEYHPDTPQEIKISGLPDALKAINTLELADDTMLNFCVDGLGWMSDLADSVAVVVDLPEYLILKECDNEAYSYDESTHMLTTTIASLSDGIALGVERLDFGAEGLQPDAEGNATLDLAFGVDARCMEDTSVMLSSLVHDGDFEIATIIDDMELNVEAVRGRVDYQYALKSDFAVKLDNLGELMIEGVGLSPVITLNVSNPLTIPLSVEGSLKDDTTREFALKDIELKPAEYVDGEIIASKNRLVLAAEERRAEFAGEDIIFVAVDYDELLRGTVPSILSIELNVGVDGSEEHTLYVAESFNIEYDYAVDLPVSLNDKLNISYSDELNGLNSIFSQIEGYNVHVGDVVIIAEIENTTPLAFDANLLLLDGDGDEANVSVVFEPDSERICGSVDGVTPAVSKLRIALGNALGEGLDLANVVDVDGLRFTLSAYSDAGERVALNENQYVGVKLWLELENVTVDVKDFLQ